MHKRYAHAHVEIDEALRRARDLWSRAEGKAALAEMRRLNKCYPGHFDVTYSYAQMLGDIARNKAQRNECIELFRKLCQSLRGRSPDERWKVRRHYYLFSKQHLKNVALGRAEIERGNRLGHLSIGFGAVHHALELLTDGKVSRAEQWAVVSSKAFETLLRLDKPLFGRCLAYALSLAIQGDYRGAERMTNKAAKLCGKAPSYFVEQWREIERIKRVRAKHG